MIHRYVAFWDRREGPESLALTRLLVGAVIFGDLASTWLAGMVPDAWAPPPLGLGFGSENAPPPSSAWLGTSAQSVTVLVGAAALASFLVMVGLFTRAAAGVLVLALAELARYAPGGDRGIDVLLRIVLLVFVLAQTDERFALGAWLRKRRGRAPAESIPAWPRYVLFAQVLWVYSSAAQGRGSAWLPRGDWSAISLVLCDPAFTRFTPGWAGSFYPVTQLATAATMAFEISAPLLLLWTWLDRSPSRGGRFGQLVRRLRVRWLWLALGVSLHLGILATLRLGIFPLGMLALYPVFLHPDEVETLLAKSHEYRHLLSPRPRS